MMVFDDRIKYFGKEGYVLGIKGYELIGVDKSRSQEALSYLKHSIELKVITLAYKQFLVI
jgi:hypothetical protein